MGKANISFPEGMLEEIDRRAAETGTTRSAFVQEATARYLAQLEHECARAERSERIERAMEGMRELGTRIPSGPEGVVLIRQMRDAVPEWLEQHPGDSGE
jgi:predicted DNA-binding protein